MSQQSNDNDFQLDDDLPTIYHFTYQESCEDEQYFIKIFVSEQEFNSLGNFSISGCVVRNNDIWLITDSFYIALNSLSQIIINEIKDDNVTFIFSGENNVE